VLRFRVTTCKKDVFNVQYGGSLEKPTFSTESADFCLSRWAEHDLKQPVSTGKKRPKAAVSPAEI
jgi:hypothetical protein